MFVLERSCNACCFAGFPAGPSFYSVLLFPFVPALSAGLELLFARLTYLL
jgi:hypothetical protein